VATRGRTFRGRGVSDSQRRKKVWIDMNVAGGLGFDASGGGLFLPTTASPGEDLAALVFPSSTNPSFAESTILRIRGVVNVPKSSYSSSQSGIECFAFGIGIISDQAAEVQTAIPNPATATGYDWDGWLTVRQSDVPPLDSNATVIDVKAMRKWRSGDSIVFVFGSASGIPAGYSGVTCGFSLRGLFLLP